MLHSFIEGPTKAIVIIWLSIFSMPSGSIEYRDTLDERVANSGLYMIVKKALVRSKKRKIAVPSRQVTDLYKETLFP
ncbi:hypothetical protein D2A38_04505 [Candidatus Liberibacter asiaticus]|nr:hypothetical protein WSI_04350 [Candidatus Liberibacter asiaticus str. gxpsy]AWL14352.1 hypothetical protein DIC79_04510 [Candidatus Liberibacter asiaticus]RKL53106.1 hypothetical protein D2A38_04505 [Candidatus Liberibacter asiaticus]